MTDYENGANLERQLCEFFEYHGFEAVRSAGSKGIFDVVAIPGKFHQDDSFVARLPVCIQAKKTKGNTKKELDSLASQAKLIHANTVWVSKEPRTIKPPKFLIIDSDPRWVNPHEFLKIKYGLHSVKPWYKAINEQHQINRDLRKIKKGLK